MKEILPKLFAKLFARRDSRSPSRSLGCMSRVAAHNRRRTHRAPQIESLEDRTLLSGWVVNAVGNLDDPTGVGVTTDSTGNVYVTGNFDGTADFDPGPSTYNLTSAGGTTDIFVAKYSPAGALVWARRAGGADPAGGDVGRSISVDSSGHVSVAGQFYGTADFGSISLTSGGNRDVFVAKLDSSGNFLWARDAGAAGFDQANGVSADSSGNVYTTGRFEGTVDFNPDPNVSNTLSTISGVISSNGTGDSDIFVWKLDTNGNFVWAKRAGTGTVDPTFCDLSGGGTNSDIGYSIAVDSSGNSYTTGFFVLTVDFNPDPLVTSNMTSVGCRDGFVWKLDTNGNFVWANRAGGTNDERSEGIAVDAGGNSYIAGAYIGSADFGSTTLSAVVAPPNLNRSDVFNAKLDATGNFVWAKSVGGIEDDLGIGIAVDSDSNVYVSGQFKGAAADFDPGPGTAYLSNIGQKNEFFLKLDGAGNFSWARRTGPDSLWTTDSRIAVDASGNVFTTGSFRGTSDFDTGSAVVMLSNNGTTPNLYILKTTQDVPTTPQIARLLDGPDPIQRGGTLTLTAVAIRVVSGGSNIASVSFYRDANKNGTLQVGTDTLLGTDTNGSNGWALNVTIPSNFKLGTYSYFAQAKDSTNVAGNIVTTTNTVTGGRAAAMVASRDLGQRSVDAVLVSHYSDNDDRADRLTHRDRLDRHTLRDLLRARRIR